MNITNFIDNIQIYIPILYVTKMTQIENDNKLVLLTIIIVYHFLLHDFHIWFFVPDSGNGR